MSSMCTTTAYTRRSHTGSGESCVGYFEYPFLNKERRAGKERYMGQNKWPFVSTCYAVRLADHPTPVGSETFPATNYCLVDTNWGGYTFLLKEDDVTYVGISFC